MRQPRHWAHYLSHALLGLGLLAASGCLGFLHPVNPPTAEVKDTCLSLPRCQRDHVYVFLMNGLDPVNYANLTGVRDYIQDLGMSRIYYGQLYHIWWFESEMRRIHQEDPQAHFVLMGFSLGVNWAYDAAETLKADGVYIDLLVFLSGNHMVAPMPNHRPANVGRILSILTDGLMGSRGQRPWAENVRLAHTLHFGGPTHPSTLALLSQELTALAASVPASEPPEPPLPPSEDKAPPPRPIKVGSPGRSKEWDFLKPAVQLGKPPSPDKNKVAGAGQAASSPGAAGTGNVLAKR